MYKLLAILLPLASGLWLTYSQFEKFYRTESLLLFPIMALCALSALIIALPTLKLKQKSRLALSVVFPYGVCCVFFFNRLFFYFALMASVLFVLPSIRERQGSCIIDFTSSGDLLVIKKYRRRTALEAYAFVSNGFMAVILIFMALTLAFPYPSKYWYSRQFITGKTAGSAYEPIAAASGRVTEAVWFNEKSLLAAGFFDIDTPEGVKPSPCKAAGIKLGDVITKIDGCDALDSDFIKNGPTEKEYSFEVLRPNAVSGEYEKLTFGVTPLFSAEDDLYRVGMNYYKGASLGASVQTLSFYYPPDLRFAATAHSFDEMLNKIENRSGALFSAVVTGRDKAGLSAIANEHIGDLKYSDGYGAFGTLFEAEGGRLLPIARKNEVRRGRAHLLSSFEGTEIREYEVYITGTYRIEGRDVLTLIAEDERIRDFGGVTRGMSGSPIIQNGKIVGALSNMDKDGISVYATYACDMAGEMTKLFGEDEKG